MVARRIRLANKGRNTNRAWSSVRLRESRSAARRANGELKAIAKACGSAERAAMNGQITAEEYLAMTNLELS